MSETPKPQPPTEAEFQNLLAESQVAADTRKIVETRARLVKLQHILKKAKKLDPDERVKMEAQVLADQMLLAALAPPPPEEGPDPLSIPSGPPISREDIKKLRAAFSRHLRISDFDWIEIVLASYLSIALVDEQPVCLMIVGASSAGKTEVVESLDGHPKSPRVHIASVITPNALLSAKQTSDGGGIDPQNSLLLRKPTIFVLIVKDLTTTLTKQKNQVADLLGNLREIADGSFKKDSGVGLIEWKGRLGMLLAVTDVIDRHQDSLAQLGPRFLLVRIQDQADLDKVRSIIANHGHQTERKTALHGAVGEFLCHTFRSAIDIALSKEFEMPLASLAVWLATARTVPSRHAIGKIGSVQAEQPYRLAIGLTTLIKCLASIRGHEAVEADDFQTVARVALDTMNPPRRAVLGAVKLLHDNGAGALTSEIATAAGVKVATTQDYLYGFAKISGALVEKVPDDEGGFTRWRLTDLALSIYSAIRDVSSNHNYSRQSS